MEEHNSKLTDEEFSQIISSGKKEQSSINVFIVYFAGYAVLEVLSVFMTWVIGGFSWLGLRCLFAYLMLSKKTAGASRLLMMFKQEGPLEEVGRRKAELFEKCG